MQADIDVIEEVTRVRNEKGKGMQQKININEEAPRVRNESRRECN